jgi:hypothetical protein
MNKRLSVLFSIVLVLGMLLVVVPKTVSAEAVAAGDWQVPTTVTSSVAVVDLLKTPAPEWLQLVTSGIKISGPAEICHPFRGSKYNWVGEIRELKNKEWVLLTTTTAEVLGTEGIYNACAKAPEAGTYAMFAYYHKADAVLPVPVQSYASNQWNTGTEVDINWVLNPSPDWLQSFSRGVVITEATEICYPFRYGQFGWVAEIRQLKDGMWVKLDTTTDFVPTVEGAYTACAQAKSAGTYELFGYLPK